LLISRNNFFGSGECRRSSSQKNHYFKINLYKPYLIRRGLVDDPPFEFDVFGGGGVEADSKDLVRFGEDLEVEIFAAADNRDINLGGGGDLGIVDGDFFLAGLESGGAGKGVGIGGAGDGDIGSFFGRGDDQAGGK
jgi:hypothetical protein